MTILSFVISVIGVAVTIAGIIFAVRPRRFDKLLSLFKRARYVCDVTEIFVERGLTVEHNQYLPDIEFYRKNNNVYFPVVPTNRPNLIHLLFVHYGKLLSSSGLRLTLFVFDHYYQRLGGNNLKLSDADVRLFVSTLDSFGLDLCKRRIIRESKYLSRSKRLKETISSLILYSYELSLGAVKEIQKDKAYINDGAQFARFLKPLFNMLYLRQTSTDYGFTLSGYDEKPLWDTYCENIDTARTYRLCNLYIPKMVGIAGAPTNVLDTENNIYYGEKIESIRSKVRSDLRDISVLSLNSCVLLILKVLLFDEKGQLEYGDNKTTVRINSISELISTLQNADDSKKERVYDSIANYLSMRINCKERQEE